MLEYKDNEITRAYVAVYPREDGSFAVGVELTKPDGKDHYNRVKYTPYVVMSLLVHEPEVSSSNKLLYYLLRLIIENVDDESQFVQCYGNLPVFLKNRSAKRKLGQFAHENGVAISSSSKPKVVARRTDPYLLADDAIRRGNSIISKLF